MYEFNSVAIASSDVPTRPPQVMLQLELLDKSIVTLSDKLHILLSRLSRVSRQEPAVVERESKPELVNVELADQLISFRSTIDILTSKVSSELNILEI